MRALFPASCGSGQVLLLSEPQFPILERKGLCQMDPRGFLRPYVSVLLLPAEYRDGISERYNLLLSNSSCIS